MTDVLLHCSVLGALFYFIVFFVFWDWHNMNKVYTIKTNWCCVLDVDRQTRQWWSWR